MAALQRPDEGIDLGSGQLSKVFAKVPVAQGFCQLPFFLGDFFDQPDLFGRCGLGTATIEHGLVLWPVLRPLNVRRGVIPG